MINDISKKISQKLKLQNLNILDKDINRPWGAFFVIDEKDSQNFANLYFNGLETDKITGKLSPKILIIAPKKRLSWQYHLRRREVWNVTSGEINVITSFDNFERKNLLFKEGDQIKIGQGERHRIIGTDNYAIIAEIWIHTDKDNPSDEHDIVRVQDDYGR